MAKKKKKAPTKGRGEEKGGDMSTEEGERKLPLESCDESSFFAVGWEKVKSTEKGGERARKLFI